MDFKKEAIVLVVLFFATFALINSVSAELMISQPSPVYNLGDKFNVNVSISPTASTNAFFTASIVCDSGQVEVYKSSYGIDAGEKKNIIIDIILENNLIGSLHGTCYLDSAYGSDELTSQKFQISRKANLNLNIGNALFNPGDQFSLTGNAVKEDGVNLNGFAQLTIPGIGISLNSLVNNGAISFNVTLSSNSQAGNYEVNVMAYEKDKAGFISNTGNSSLTIGIRQVTRRIDLALSNQNALIGDNLSYAVLLYDQADNPMISDATIKITRPDNSLLSNKIIKSSSSQTLSIDNTFPSGNWRITSDADNFEINKSFYVAEQETAVFNLDNNTLIINNTGNVPYIKDIQISIGDYSEVKKISLKVGESRKFILSAPSGKYFIGVNDGNSNQTFNLAYLSGNAVNIRDASTLNSGSALTLWLWIIIILILAIIALFYYLKVRKKRYYGHEPLTTPFYKNEKRANQDEIKSARSMVFEKIPENMATKEPVLPLNKNPDIEGQKNEVGVIALKLKNFNQLIESESNAMAFVSQALEIAKQAGGKSYDQGDFKVIILSKSLTKIQDNILLSVKIANDIKKMLDNHNKRYAMKMDFGIGVNCGDMILEFIGGKAKFTSIGGTTIGAKRAAELANSEILITRQVYRKVSGKVKTEKAVTGNLFKVLQVIDRSKHSEFIKKFMDKQ